VRIHSSILLFSSIYVDLCRFISSLGAGKRSIILAGRSPNAFPRRPPSTKHSGVKNPASDPKNPGSNPGADSFAGRPTRSLIKCLSGRFKLDLNRPRAPRSIQMFFFWWRCGFAPNPPRARAGLSDLNNYLDN
jgi:hypothetical protein